MGDAPARTELKVTTGPIRGSRKIYVEGRDGVRVAMRAVDLEPSSGEPPVVLYDTSGPYTDPEHRIDIMAGLPELRREWIRGRGDVEEVAQREVRPEDNGQLGPDRSGGVAPFPRCASACFERSRAPTSPRCITPGAGSSRPRWNMSRSARTSAARPR
jgi:phosphomethylpyrimidine synthase